MKWAIWRALMRFTHRFGWCRLREQPQIERYTRRYRCDWCGAFRADYTGPLAVKSAPSAERRADRGGEAVTARIEKEREK